MTVLDRGYTGHEHLQAVNLIHMNGRVYDPVMHRFLQVDNYIQDPFNTQNYNRYGYVLNNPLKYADYSGEYSEEPAQEQPGPDDQNALAGLMKKLFEDYGDDVVRFGEKRWEDVKDIGTWVGNQVRSVKNFLNPFSWFDKGGTETRSFSPPQLANLNMGQGWQNSGFTGVPEGFMRMGLIGKVSDKNGNFFTDFFTERYNDKKFETAESTWRTAFDTMELVGGMMEVGGVALIPFTEGASAFVTAVGGIVSGVGTAGHVVMDVMDGDYRMAGYRVV